SKARAELGVESCVSCHREHKGVRATMIPTACATCHQNLELKLDPLDVSHRKLVARKEWTSCLGCHDFHGNHNREIQTGAVVGLCCCLRRLSHKGGDVRETFIRVREASD